MSDGLNGRHVVVTGGARGLGAAIAAACAAEGAIVTRLSRKTTPGVAFSPETTPEVVFCDVTDPAAVAAAFREAVKANGPVHILVNNAGVAPASALQDTTLAEWQETLAVNLTGPFLCTQQVLPGMLAAGSGRIINMASTAGLTGYARVAAYCASKHGLVGLTRALAAETARTGVTVNAVCPGYIEGSSMLEAAIANVARVTGKSPEAARSILSKQSPSGRFITATDVVRAVLDLCRDSASNVTGQAIVIDGREES